MSIRTKILGGFLSVSLLGMILGATGFISARMLSDKTDELHVYSQQSDSFTNILNTHYAWRNGLTEAVITGSEFRGSLDPKACALGQWMDSDAAAAITDGTLLELIARIAAPHEYIHHEAENVLALLEDGDREGAMGLLMTNILPEFNAVITDLVAISQRYSALVDGCEAEVAGIVSVTQILIAVLIVVALAGSVYLALLISGMVSKPLVPLTAFLHQASSTGDMRLNPEEKARIDEFGGKKDEIGKTITATSDFVRRVIEVSGLLGAVAEGDLTVSVKPLSDRDTLGLSLEKMTQSLNRMFGEINESAMQVSTGAGHVADGSQALAQGSTEQAASVGELSGSIAEIAEKTKANSLMAEKAASLAEVIKGSAKKGSNQMEEMMTAVKEINEASQSISKVIKTIDDIAFQTNILALNAAVEAARAGQHGKGFAVVAEEVRNLAAKSADAAKDTESLIANSMDKAAFGVRIAGETYASLAEIVSGINESNSLIAEIAKASDDQLAGISQLNTGIAQVADVVRQNSETAEKSAAASEEMSGQSDMLRELISRFRIKDDAKE